jgi:hypothetical protein
MTNFTIPEEALDVALRASFAKACEVEGKQFDEDEYQGHKSESDKKSRQHARELIRAAIAAALPVMFERVGHFTASARIYCEQPADIHDVMNPGVAVYRIKEPK